MRGTSRPKKIRSLEIFDTELEKETQSGVERQSLFCKICYTQKFDNEDKKRQIKRKFLIMKQDALQVMQF